MRCCEDIMGSSPNSSDISKPTSLIVAVISAGHQSTLTLHHPTGIPIGFTDTHFATKEDLRLCKIKPQKGFTRGKLSLEAWVLNNLCLYLQDRSVSSFKKHEAVFTEHTDDGNHLLGTYKWASFWLGLISITSCSTHSCLN